MKLFKLLECTCVINEMYDNGMRRNVKVAINNSGAPLKNNSRACNSYEASETVANPALLNHAHAKQWFSLANESHGGKDGNSSCESTHFSLELGRTIGNPNIPLLNNDCHSLIPVWCELCDGYGHLSRDCPKASIADGARRKVCANCCSRDHTDHNRCPQKLCPICFDAGHIKTSCPRQRKTNSLCYRCGLRGHEKATCPEIWRQFFLVTDESKIDTSENAAQVNPREFCCICADEGHFYTNCPSNPSESEHANFSFKTHRNYFPNQGSNNVHNGGNQSFNQTARRGGTMGNGINRSLGRYNRHPPLDARKRKPSMLQANNRPGLLELNSPGASQHLPQDMQQLAFTRANNTLATSVNSLNNVFTFAGHPLFATPAYLPLRMPNTISGYGDEANMPIADSGSNEAQASVPHSDSHNSVDLAPNDQCETAASSPEESCQNSGDSAAHMNSVATSVISDPQTPPAVLATDSHSIL